MNGEENGATTIDAVLPSGAAIRLRVAEGAGDGMGSVGLVDPAALEEALATIAEATGDAPKF